MRNENRRLELSGKLMQMGHSLIEEGNSLADYTVTQSGTIMILISSLLLSDEDMFMFSEICSMFSAKKILDAAEGLDEIDLIHNLMKKKQTEKIIKKPRVKKPKKDNDNDSENK